MRWCDARLPHRCPRVWRACRCLCCRSCWWSPPAPPSHTWSQSSCDVWWSARSPGLGPGPAPAPLPAAVVHGVEETLAVPGPVPGHPGPGVGRVQVEVIRLGPHRHHGQPGGAGHGVAGRHADPSQARALKQRTINKYWEFRMLKSRKGATIEQDNFAKQINGQIYQNTL